MVLLFLLANACKKNERLDESDRLAVSAYFPNSGKAGTLVTIEGTGFGTDLSAVSVLFGEVPADVVSATASGLVVRAPEGGRTGQISVHRGDRSVGVGTYTYQSLSVQSLQPTKAQVGSQVWITGTGFSSLEGPVSVKLNGHQATVLSASDTVVSVQVPEGTGRGPVEVSVDGMDAAGPDFAYLNIHRLKPMSGGAGTRLVIEGEGFDAVASNNVVSINGKVADMVESSENQLVVIAPDDVESGPVVVEIADEPVIGPDFTVVPLPTITSVTPLSGPAGTEMVIIGETFSEEEGETRVYIAGQEIPLQTISATKITLVVPEGTPTGELKVVVNDQATAGPQFKNQTLGIQSISPEDGLAGTEVTITGTGFHTTPEAHTVMFSGVPAQVIAATENTLTVVAPEDFSTGRLSVSVNGMQAEASAEFKRAGVVTLADGARGLQVSAGGGSLAADDQGNVYVLEIDQHRIVKISPEGEVSHFVGSTTGTPGADDGAGAAASFRFDEYAGIVYDGQQYLYVSDPGNRTIRRITLQGEVATLLTLSSGSLNKVALGQNGDLYIPSGATGSNLLHIRLRENAYSSYVSVGATGQSPLRLAVDIAGNVYTVRSAMSARITKSTPNGSTFSNVLTWAGATTATGYQDGVGTAALLDGIRSLVPYDARRLLVLDANNYALRLVDILTVEVTTLFKGSEGLQDGDFRNVKLSNGTWDLAISPDGLTAYILDCGNNTVRKVMLR